MIVLIKRLVFPALDTVNRFYRSRRYRIFKFDLCKNIKVVLCFLAVLVCTGLRGQQAQLETILLRAHDRGFYGSVLMAKKGRPIYSKMVGPEITEDDNPMEKIFPIASITKFFTSIIVFQCIEEGLMTLDSSFSHDEISIIPETYGPITVEELLLHTSGLPKEPDGLFGKRRSPRTMIKRSFRNKDRNERAFNYKNVDYILLGLILEQITGKSFASLLEERIIEPYGLERTGLIRKKSDYGLFSSAFTTTGKTYGNIGKSFHLENYYSAGAMYSTTGDLLRLDRALREGNVLALESQEKLYTAFPEFNYSAYGVWVYHYPFLPSNPRIMERRGSIQGYRSVLVRFLDKDNALVILANSNYFDPSTFGDPKNLKEVLIKVADVF